MDLQTFDPADTASRLAEMEFRDLGRFGDGAFLVVPRGCWHRQYMRRRTTEFYLTPGRTLHSTMEDPRAKA